MLELLLQMLALLELLLELLALLALLELLELLALLELLGLEFLVELLLEPLLLLERDALGLSRQRLQPGALGLSGRRYGLRFCEPYSKLKLR